MSVPATVRAGVLVAVQLSGMKGTGRKIDVKIPNDATRQEHQLPNVPPTCPLQLAYAGIAKAQCHNGLRI